MLALNHGDNQGVRYLLLSLLFEKGNFEDAALLMKEYGDDYSVDWAYSKVLLEFKENGPTKKVTICSESSPENESACVFVPYRPEESSW